MPRYEANNQVYNIPDDQVDLFIQTNPEAILLEEEVKIEGAPNVDANVAPKPVPASENMESKLEDSSLVSRPQYDSEGNLIVYKKYVDEDAFQIVPVELEEIEIKTPTKKGELFRQDIDAAEQDRAG